MGAWASPMLAAYAFARTLHTDLTEPCSVASGRWRLASVSRSQCSCVELASVSTGL